MNVTRLTTETTKLELQEVSVQQFVVAKLRELGAQKNRNKRLWIFLRIVIMLLDFIVLAISSLAIFKSVEEFTGKLQHSENVVTFIGTVGPTISLCIFIILLFLISSYLVFFTSRTQFQRYRLAMQEIQEFIIHYKHGSSKKIPEEELLKEVRNIYKRALRKRKGKILHNVREDWMDDF